MTNPIPEPKKKRKKNVLKECPYCHAHYGNVSHHIAAVHAKEAAEGGREVEKPEPSKEDLLGEGKPPTPKPENTVYYCQSCRAKVRKGEGSCWNCGKRLLWEGIE